MTNYPFDKNMSNEHEVLDFFADAISYRNAHKDQSTDIAFHVFEMTYPQFRLSFPISAEIDCLRNEFIALEAPGSSPDDTQSDADYDDQVWARLLGLVSKTKEKRTV